MKPRDSHWLDIALRAQRARTMDHQRSLHEARVAQQHAAELEAAADGRLRALAGAWRHGRDAGALAADMDGLYQRYHSHLRLEASSAAHAHRKHEHAAELAQARLQQSHSLQQALDKSARRRDQRSAKEALTRERNRALETWMLDKTTKERQA